MSGKDKREDALIRLGITSEIIVESLAKGGVLTGAMLLKMCSAFFVQGRNGWRRHSDFVRSVDSYTDRLIERGIIVRAKDGSLQLTKKGEWEASRRRYFDNPDEHIPSLWDRRWRMIIFDIPEIERKKRVTAEIIEKRN